MATVTGVQTNRAKRLFDVISAIVLLIIASPFMLICAIRSKYLFRRVFDSEPVIGSQGEAVNLLRFSGLKKGRNLALLLNVAAGEIAWVGPLPARDIDQEEPTNMVRPGLICRQRLQKLTGTDYDNNYVTENIEYGLTESLALIGRYFIARVMGPEYSARQSAQFKLLDVQINNLSIAEALSMIAERIESKQSSRFAFVNPDCLNKAVTDSEYAQTLKTMDAVFADGIGLQIASRMMGYQLKANINGTDLFPLLCDQSERLGHSIFLLGGQPGVAASVAKKMQENNSGLSIVGTQHGFFDAADTPEVIDTINRSGADILLVAFGAPRQEAWLTSHMPQIDAKVGMGVGGLFDFYSGRISRSPRWLRDIGLEWTWRFIQEPGRMWRRYFIGNPLFLFRMWRQTRQESGRRVLERYSGGRWSLKRADFIASIRTSIYTSVVWCSRAVRRLIDIVVSASAILVLSPLLIIVAISIKLESTGPIFFSQQRVGKWGKFFKMYKFRSMCTDAEHLKQELKESNEMDGGVLFKMKQDPRITRTGLFIRKYSIDELPQLWNVLVGNMALVGPRPPVPSEVDQYDLSDRRRLDIKPGITCFWQVSGRSEIPFDQQVELDVEYIESQSIKQDINILLRTIPAVLLGKGAY